MAAITFAPATKPGTFINIFIRQEAGATVTTSSLPALIIGEKYNIIEDSLAGTYEGEQSQIFFPEAEASQKVLADSVKIVLKDVVLSVADSSAETIRDHSSTSVADITGVTLTDSSEDFVTTNPVEIGDTLDITYTVSAVPYSISAIVTNVATTVLTVSKPLPTVADVKYVVTRHNGEFAAFGNVLKTNVVDGFQDVYPNDIVKILHPTQGAVTANVVAIIDTDEIKLNKSFSSTVNVKYEIERANSNRSSVIGITAGAFNTNPTDILEDLSGIGFTAVKIGDEIRIIRGGQIDSAIVIGLIDTYRIQLSKTFASGSISYKVTRTQQPNSPLRLTDDINDFILLDTDDDKYVDNTYFQIQGSLQVSDLDGNLTIKKANVYVDYVALSVVDANRKISIEDDSQIESKVGKLDYRNPLGLAVSLAAANTLEGVYAIAIEDNTNAAWLKALDAAENYDDIYNLCLLTQSMTIQSFAKSHVDGMSIASKHGWRVLWMNLPHIFEEVIRPQTENGKLEYVPDVNGDYIRFFDPAADFSSIPATSSYIAFWENGELFDSNDKPVTPTFFKVVSKGEDENILVCDTSAYVGEETRGIYVKTKAESTANILGTYDPLEETLTSTTNVAFPNVNSTVINTGDLVVLNDQTIVKENGVFRLIQKGDSTSPWILKKDKSLSAVDAIDIIGAPVSGSPKFGTYKIIKLLDKTEQAQAIANVANSFASRRVLYITNEECIIEIDGIDRTLPGYHITAAYAGLSSARTIYPHQPFTNFPVAGIKAVLKTSSDEYFSLVQQGIIVKGGGWLCEQNVFASSPIKAWQQVTTDNSSPKTREFSFTRNLDDIVKKIYAANFGQGGIHNNIDEARTLLSRKTSVVLDSLTKGEFTSPINGILGPQIITVTVSGLEEDPSNPLASVADIDLVLPLPLNDIIYNVYS